MRLQNTPPRWLSAIPLFWRVFLLNGMVLMFGVAALGLSPATVSWPLLHREMVVLAVGLCLMLLADVLLLRLGFAPLDRLIGVMDTVDLLHPGQRLDERGSPDVVRLTRAFNNMIDRLEAERASSAAHALSAQEAERRRIARELHDEIGQSLTVVLLELSRLCEEVPEPSRAALREVLETTRHSLTDVRMIAQRLRPDALEDLGLLAALSTLVDDFTQFSGVPVARNLSHIPPLSSEAEVVVFRIAQESLTNIARHAGASQARLSLDSFPGDSVRLQISDDGTGVRRGEGAGIRGMRERALLVQGKLSLTSLPGAGTTVTLDMPSDNLRREV